MDYNLDDFQLALKRSGIKHNDSIFLTTSLGMLGLPKLEKKISYNKIAISLLKSIKSIIGSNGNIFVPTYSYSFNDRNDRKENIYSLKKTKSKIGNFSNFFLKQKGCVRSIDPMVSIAGIGRKCKKILKVTNYTSYGKNCIFQKLLKINNLKCCNVGLGVNWVPFIHHLDWVNQAPFRYVKFFEGVIIEGNIRKKIKWHYPVRYLRKEADVDGYKIGKMALEEKLFNYSKIGKSKIYVINYKKFFNFAKKVTSDNKWLTVRGPEFN